MIRVENVTKSYMVRGLQRYYVFRGLNLEIPGNTNVGIIGRNGAGKSTLLRLLGQVDLPDRGRITISDAGRVSSPMAGAAGMAASITGRHNAKFVCRINGDTPQQMAERVRGIEEFVELGEYFDLPISMYSSGMRSRLVFGINMAFDFDYYLLDEITAVGDQKFKEKAAEVFEKKKGKASMIMVSHSLQALRKQCQVGVYVRRGGEVHVYDSMDEAVDTYLKDIKQ
jgi:capsular polysaccharide transport system ATP-binding protein